MTNPLVWCDTIGCVLVITVPCDLVTNVTKVEIKVRKPSMDEDTWTPDFVTWDPETGKSTISYETRSSDLDEYGTYRVQPCVTLDDGDFWPLGVAIWKIIERYEVS